MLSYFKINDPFRLVPLLLIAFLLKLPAFFNISFSSEITHWFVIGEAMQTGSMYRTIWDGMAPFSASIYQVITWLFDRSILTLYILGTILTFIQAIIINNFSLKAKIFESNTYLPALIFVLFTSSHPAFFTLSPSLMGLTFILLGLGNLLNHVEFRAKKDIQIIMIGLYFGSALLFYLPFIAILPIAIILLLFFTKTTLRRYLLLGVTFFSPLLIGFIYYWLTTNHPSYFIQHFLFVWNGDSYYSHIGWRLGATILLLPLLFTFVGIISFGQQRLLTNYQSRIFQLMLLMGAFLMSMMLIENPVTQFSLVVYSPITTYITVHFIALFKRTLYILLINVIILIGPFVALLGDTHNWSMYNTIDKQLVENVSPYESLVKNKSIMVLGSAQYLYREAKLAGPFYDWGLSENFFSELDYYDNLLFLQSQIEVSRPQVIVDLENNWNKIERHLPTTAKKFYKSEPNIWLRVR